LGCEWLNELNDSQREAATHGEGPLLVVAGAGTGKTRTLVCRVAHLLQRGVAADRILLLTFTRRAAAEMLRRVEHLTQSSAGAKVWGGTFHAVANRLLRIYGRQTGLSPDFTVMDASDAADLMNLVRSELGVVGGKRRFPRKETLVAIYSRTVNAQEPLKAVLRRHFPWCAEWLAALGAIFAAYQERKRAGNLLDYDDLLLAWQAMCDAPGVGGQVADRFEHILVDEYQDTNVVQGAILRGMRRRYENLMVVGDDAQSIYSFRAATVRNILDFPRHFPGARLIKLEENYRSTMPILTLSNLVIAQARERYEKNLRSQREAGRRPVLTTCGDEAEQSDEVCRHILQHLEQGVPLKRQAVLFRAGHHSDHLEVELARRRIPFHKYGGLKFIEAAHIKDVLAYLRILENPFDEISWYRVLMLLPGIGTRTARRIMQDLGVRTAAGTTPRAGDEGEEAAASRAPPGGGEAALSPLARLWQSPPAVPPSAKREMGALAETLAECCGVRVGQGEKGAAPSDLPRAEVPLAVQLERIRAYYDPLLERAHENAAARRKDLEQLEQIAAGYTSRARLVTDLTLDPPASTADLAGPPYLEEDYLTLSTIHSAKGCEWDVVHILHAADGMIPSDMAVQDEAGVEEERRLLYVAMTRARDMLYLYFPLRYYHRGPRYGDAHSLAQLTRFLPAPARRHLDQRQGEGARQARAAGHLQLVSERTRRLWEN
jgi:DNA helicase-2/ATP-dependent DNA helicase PcrA